MNYECVKDEQITRVLVNYSLKSYEVLYKNLLKIKMIFPDSTRLISEEFLNSTKI